MQEFVNITTEGRLQFFKGQTELMNTLNSDKLKVG